MTQAKPAAYPAVPFLGVGMAALDMDESLAAIANMSRGDTFSYVVTPNVDHFVNLYPKVRDTSHDLFRAAYLDADLVLCDSRIVAGLARLSGLSLNVVPGSDLTAQLFARQLTRRDRVAIIGGDAALKERLSASFPEPDYVQYIPPMGVLQKPGEMQKIVAFVARCDAQYVLFAIGAPQSEIAAHLCAQSGRCKGVGLCIGASLEFIVSAKKRAPLWMQQRGLEWAYRLASEPRRLWRRYLVEGPRIFLIYLKHRNDSRFSQGL